MRFSDVDIDLETLTSMELKDFIRQGIDYINELYKHNESEGIRFKKPQQHFFDEIQSKTTRGRFGNKLGYGVNVNKEKLLDKANDIRIFLKLSKDYDTEKVNRAYLEFQNKFKGVTREEYGKIVNTLGALGTSILEKFPSKHVISLVQQYPEVSSTKIINIILKAIDNPENKTQGDLLHDVKEKMKEYVNIVNRFKKKQ